MTRFQIIGVKKQSGVLTELDLKLKSNHVVRGRSNKWPTEFYKINKTTLLFCSPNTNGMQTQ